MLQLPLPRVYMLQYANESTQKNAIWHSEHCCLKELCARWLLLVCPTPEAQTPLPKCGHKEMYITSRNEG